MLSPVNNSMFCILIIISLLSLVEVHAQGDHNSSFLNLDSIRSKSVLLYDNATYLNQHRLYPNLTFTCNGTIDNITFLATYLNGTFGSSFSLWSTEDNSTWILQGSRVRLQDHQSQCEEDGKLCILSLFDVSLKFEADYQFGVQLNGGRQRAYDLIHLSEGGFSRYTGLTARQRNSTTLTFKEIDGAVPLLTIKTDHPECVQGFLSKDVFMHAAEIVNYKQIVSNSNDQFEFELQQCSCLAQVTDLLFAGSFDPAEMDVSTTNLTINLTITDSNTSETFSLSNQTVQMTDTLNIFKYVLNFSRIELQTRNVSVKITLDGGIIPLSSVVPVCCTQDSEYLIFTSLFIDNIENEVSIERLLLFPDMTFQASGNISLWTFTARRDTSSEESSEIEFLVWRPSINCDTMNTEYELVGSNAVTDAKPTEFLNVYEYSVPQSNQIQVQKGDVFAVFQSGGDAFSPVFVTNIGHLYYKPQLNGMNRNREKMEFVSSGHYLFPMVSFNMTMTGGDHMRSNTANNCTDDDDGTGLRRGIIFGCGAAGFVVLLIIVVVLVILLRKSRKQAKMNLNHAPLAIPSERYIDNLVVTNGTASDNYETIPPPLPTRNEAHYDAVELDMKDGPQSPGINQLKEMDSPVVLEYTYVPVPSDFQSFVAAPSKLESNQNKDSVDSESKANGTESGMPSGTDPDGYASFDLEIFVPTLKQRVETHAKTATNEFAGIYATLGESMYSRLGKSQVTFFEDIKEFWTPSDDQEGLYEQLSSNKYREIPRQRVEIKDMIGSGEFGNVNKGVWHLPGGGANRTVAIKTLRDGTEEEQKLKFIQEAAINGQFHHQNIVKLYGVVTLGEPVLIVLEHMVNGDLRSHLQQMNPLPPPTEESHSSTPLVLLRFSKQVAAGMAYLSSKHYVHRDLAARNILVSSEGNCKISDFGMSRELEENPYYVSHGGKVPVKWTAPEAIRYKKYSTKSDVWSFGAVLYEIWSVGKKPFQDFTAIEAIRKVTAGYRLPPPPGCPREIYRIMIQCWDPDKSSRPTFPQLSQELSQNPHSTGLLKVGGDNTNKPHPQADVLGAPLEAGHSLYTNLQHSYHTPSE